MAALARLRFLAMLLAAPLAVFACSGSRGEPVPPGDSRNGPAGSGAAQVGATTATATQASTDAQASTSTSTRPGPPTIETCRALAKPAGSACQWVLVPTSYCGGPPPLPQMLWPHCSCEACAADADCRSGEHCATLPTDAECGAPKNICLGSWSQCDEKGGCGKGEQCMWIDGKAACKVPTIYPPRP